MDGLQKGVSPLEWIKDPKNYLYTAVALISCIVLSVTVDFNSIPDITVNEFSLNGGYVGAVAVGWLNNSIIRALLNKFTNIE
jgi:hypothetical protein